MSSSLSEAIQVQSYVTLLMLPIANCNLAEFFPIVLGSSDRRSLLRSFWVVSQLLLRDAQIKNKDLKPQNILVKERSVLLTDFGVSRNWTDLPHSETQNSTVIIAPRYSAPEVAKNEPRNSSSEMWSLGCVLLEVVTVLKGETLDTIKAFFDGHGSKRESFGENLDAIRLQSAKFTVADGQRYDNIPPQ
jgi:serine/threonine protein kinase